MADLVLFYLKLGAFLLISTAVCIKFRKVRNFSALGIALGCCTVMRIVQSWSVFFLVMKPHASRAAGDLIKSRLDNAFAIFCAIAFTIAIYYLGGKPITGFWQWIRGEDGHEIAGAQPTS